MSKFKVGDLVEVNKDCLMEDVTRGARGHVLEPQTSAEYVSVDIPTGDDDHTLFLEGELDLVATDDNVNHPDHYKWLPVEAIEITEHFNFCMGNALKYILRADHKGKPVEDISKAIWYLQRELENRKKA